VTLNQNEKGKMEIEALKVQLYHAYISQKMVAEHAGVHKSYVSKVFNGQRYSKKVIQAAKDLLKQRNLYLN